MKEGPGKTNSIWQKLHTTALISATVSALALGCATSDKSRKTTPEDEAGEVGTTVIKIKRRFAKFCGPEKEVNRYAEDICIEGTIRKFKEEGIKCVECEREIEVTK